MAEDFDVQLASISNELFNFLEREVPDKLRVSLNEICRLRQDITATKAELDDEIQQLDKHLATMTDDTTIESLDDAQALIDKTKSEQQREKAIQEQLIAQKAEVKGRFKEIMDKHDNCKKQLEDSEQRLAAVKESEGKANIALMAKLTYTGYKLNSDARCVSLILDEDKNIHRAVLCDKENQPQSKPREEIWSYFERTVNTNIAN